MHGNPVDIIGDAPAERYVDALKALGADVPRPERFAGIEDLPRQVVDLPNDAAALKDLIAAG